MVPPVTLTWPTGSARFPGLKRPSSCRPSRQFPVTVKDKQNKPVATVIVPIDANVEIAEMKIPIPTLK